MPSSVTALIKAAGLKHAGCVKWGEPIPDSEPGIYLVSMSSDQDFLPLTPSTAPISTDAVSELLEARPAISDAVTPVARPPVVGVYRFWRDMGYAAGALVAGTAADTLGYGGAIALVAGMTAASGLWVLFDMPAANMALSATGARQSRGRVPPMPASSNSGAVRQ
jgi:hypothetical protein